MQRLSVVLAVVLAGCSMSVDTELAEQAVPKFHEMLDAGQFEAIYATAAGDLRNAAKREDFVALLDAVHRKLGTTKSSEQKGWKVKYHTSGTFVTLNYSTVYEEGEATERFVYRLQDGKAVLAGYHISSTAFVTK
jgi:hypothetical protein